VMGHIALILTLKRLICLSAAFLDSSVVLLGACI